MAGSPPLCAGGCTPLTSFLLAPTLQGVGGDNKMSPSSLGIPSCVQDPGVAWVKAPKLQRRPSPQGTLSLTPEDSEELLADLSPGGDKPQGLGEPRVLGLKSRGPFSWGGFERSLPSQGPERWGLVATHASSPDCPVRDRVRRAMETSRKLALATHSQEHQQVS